MLGCRIEPGFTGAVDRQGYEIDSGITFPQRYIEAGRLWRLDAGVGAVVSLSVGSTPLIVFTTPATGVTYYSSVSAEKSGGAVVLSFVEGGTLTGGSAITARNYNRATAFAATDSSTFFTSKTGGSLANGTTLASAGLLGTDNPSTKPGGATQSGVFFRLKAGTLYAVLGIVASGTVSAMVHLDLLHLDGDI